MVVAVVDVAVVAVIVSAVLVWFVVSFVGVVEAVPDDSGVVEVVVAGARTLTVRVDVAMLPA